MKKSNTTKETAKIFFTFLNLFIYIGLFLAMLYFVYPNVGYFINGYVFIGTLYTVFIIVFGKMFEINELGESRVYDIFLSYSLTTFVVNFISWFIICLVSFRTLHIWGMVGLQLIFEVIAAYALLLENRFIRDHYPVPKAIAIFGEPNYEILTKIHKFRDIIVNVSEKKDVDKIDFDKLDQILDGYERVITIDVEHNQKKLIFKKCYEKRITIFDVPSISDTLIASSSVMHAIDTPILKIGKFGPSALESMIKRLIDIVGSLTLIVLTSPIMLIVSIAIKIQDGGDILFKQERLTLDGKVFKIFKFRSMIMNAEKKTGAVLAKEGDSRITPVGKFIRKTRFDELPQLFNILSGDMTFVGPRPERPVLFDEICKDIPEFKYRLTVKAGLTGYAQIYGKYNTSMRDKLLLDIYYIENYSVIADIKLLVMTLKVIFMPESTEGVK